MKQSRKAIFWFIKIDIGWKNKGPVPLDLMVPYILQQNTDLSRLALTTLPPLKNPSALVGIGLQPKMWVAKADKKACTEPG